MENVLKVKTIVGWTLKQCRKHLGYKQKEFGEMLGYSESTADTRVAQYECDARHPKKETISKICELLGIAEQAILPPSVETELGAVHTLMHLDTIYGLEMKKDNGEIYICFPQDCKTIRYYIEQLYHLKELIDNEQIEKSTYQYMKATFGKNYE